MVSVIDTWISVLIICFKSQIVMMVGQPLGRLVDYLDWIVGGLG